MYQKIAKRIFSVVFLSAVPAFLSYLANSSLVFDKLIELQFLSEKINVALIQDYCLLASILFSALALSLNLIFTQIRHDQILEQRNSLIKMNKDILSSSLGKRFLSDTSSFDIRIFVPKYPILYDVAKKVGISKIPKKFVIKNIDLISEPGITKNLQFEVSPKEEGLVGWCYQTKSMVYDDDLEHTNDKLYMLNKNQIDRTSNLKWSICCPVMGENDDVVAIVALDGKTRINIDKGKEATLREEITAFCCMLYDSVPQLFYRR